MGPPSLTTAATITRVLMRRSSVLTLSEFRQAPRRARAQGRYLGVGIASYVEDTGLAPFEGAKVTIQPQVK